MRGGDLRRRAQSVRWLALSGGGGKAAYPPGLALSCGCGVALRVFRPVGRAGIRTGIGLLPQGRAAC